MVPPQEREELHATEFMDAATRKISRPGGAGLQPSFDYSLLHQQQVSDRRRRRVDLAIEMVEFLHEATLPALIMAV